MVVSIGNRHTITPMSVNEPTQVIFFGHSLVPILENTPRIEDIISKPIHTVKISDGFFLQHSLFNQYIFNIYIYNIHHEIISQHDLFIFYVLQPKIRRNIFYNPGIWYISVYYILCSSLTPRR